LANEFTGLIETSLSFFTSF